MNTIGLVSVLLAITLALQPTAQERPQDRLEEAKAQYAAADYEEALTSLAAIALPPDQDREQLVELELYRALCLIALGRTAEAGEALTTLFTADPTYTPPSSIASPRVRSLFAEIRDGHLPVIVRNLLANGREAYEAGALARAKEDFALVLTLLEDPALKDWPDRTDVRVLAVGFAMLAAASPADAGDGQPVAALPTPALDPGPPVQAAPVAAAPTVDADSSRLGTNGHETEPAAPAVAAADTSVHPPVAVLQTMPAWEPPDTIAQSRGYKGVLKVRIGVDGRVKAASIEEPTHPAYDVRLIHAARQWVFKPATRGGEPIESETIIAVQLHPRDRSSVAGPE